jgi:flagellar biosynthesis/type III secretory pathway chaperone
MLQDIQKTLWAIADKLRAMVDDEVVEVEDSDEASAEKMQKLTEQLGEQMAKSAKLDQLIRQKLGGLGV